MKTTATFLLGVVGLAAIVAITVTAKPPKVDHDIDAMLGDCADVVCEWAAANRVDDVEVTPVVEPADPQPVKQGGQWTINCSSVDAGTTVTDLLAPDAGVPKIVDTVYVAPIVGSSVKVRVGFSPDIGGAAVSSSLGFEVGSGAREGPGISMNASGRLRCKSEGAAQLVEVIAGRNQ